MNTPLCEEERSTRPERFVHSLTERSTFTVSIHSRRGMTSCVRTVTGLFRSTMDSSRASPEAGTRSSWRASLRPYTDTGRRVACRSPFTMDGANTIAFRSSSSQSLNVQMMLTERESPRPVTLTPSTDHRIERGFAPRDGAAASSSAATRAAQRKRVLRVMAERIRDKSSSRRRRTS